MSPTHAERTAHVASVYGGDWAAYWRDVATAKASNNTLGEEWDRAERARKAESERG